MDQGSFAAILRERAPKVFTALARFLDGAQLVQLASDYCACEERGGNVEQGMVREEGVSFNPRLARILSLLIADGRVRDFNTLRAALYAASSARIPEGNPEGVPGELLGTVSAVWSRCPESATAALIRGVLELDALRHLHQTQYPQMTRLEMLGQLEEYLREDAAELLPEWLRKKLEHAITLQRRHAEFV